MRSFVSRFVLIASVGITLAIAVPTSRKAVADAFLRVAPFPTLVTRPVVTAAVDDFVESVRQWNNTLNIGPDSYAAQHPEALTRFANDSARFAVWDWQFTNPHDQNPHEGCNRVGCSYRYDSCEGMPKDPKLARWRRDLSEAARAYLRNPDRLAAFYRAHRDDVLKEIRTLGGQAEVREYLNSILPYFSESPSSELRRAEANYQRTRQQAVVAMKGCICAENWTRGIGDAEGCSECKTGKAELAAYQAAQGRLARLTPDWMAFEWANRRRTEGGERLVGAWAVIIDDLIHSI